MTAILSSCAIGTHAAGNRLHTINIRISGPSGTRSCAGGSQLRPSIRSSGRTGQRATKSGTRASALRVEATAVARIKATRTKRSAPSKWIRTSLMRTDPEYQQTKFEIDFLPPKAGVAETGVVMFCHGFEQVPQDYDTVLRRLASDGNWVVAPVQPQYVPMDPVLKLLGGSREVLQGIVHADACQVAALLLDKGADGSPKLNELGNGVVLPDLSDKQVAISGHSLGGGLTWSVVQRFPGRFDKLAVMAPFPDMVSDALTPATVIGQLDPATGKPFQPPTDSLIIDGGLDVLALAFRITANIIKPLETLQPPPHFTTFQFPFGTHTGYQDFTGIGNVVKFPAGVLITIPEQRVTTLQSAVGGNEQKPRAELILGAAANTKVITLPRALEDLILQAVSINKYAIYFVLLAALLAVSKATGAIADHAGPLLGPLFGLISIVSFLLIPLELFEVFYYTPFVQRPQTADMIGDFLSTSKKSD